MFSNLNLNLNLESTLKKFQVQLKRVGGGAKFFNAAGKRGESVELHQDLSSNDRERQKNALKRIIANMTLGRDVSQLFADVVKLGQTPNLEVKKLVYLYVLNNAKLQPDKALMAVNTFLQDASHASPIVRSLSLRTMLCLRVDTVLEYTIPPLIAALNTTGEADAYVRKTAAIGVGKVYHQNPAMFESHGLMQHLIHLLSDTFPIVSSNAAMVLAEILTIPGQPTVEFQKQWVAKLLTALPDCTEWGQVYILEALSLYQPAADEVENMADRVLPRLSHANSAIVLAAIKVIAMCVIRMPPAQRATYTHRISAAMLTLAKSDPETQYIVCRNAQMLLNIFPDLLSENFDSFYIRFSDPPFVKLEKLRLLLRLVNSNSAAGVIKEFAEYAHEVDPVFIAEVVGATAVVATKVESVAERAAELLKDIVTRQPEMLPQTLVASMEILRKYPNLVIDLVPPLVALGADSVTEETARAAFAWMLGEFCEVIDGLSMLTAFVESFPNEEPAVQTTLLTAVMKVFLRNPAAIEASLTKVIDLSTRCTRNPDLRDRGLVYYRLLSRGVPVAKLTQIVLGRKPATDASKTFHDNMTPLEMMRSVNTVAAVYAQPPRKFLLPYGCAYATIDDDEEEEAADDAAQTDLPAVTAAPDGLFDGKPTTATATTTTTTATTTPATTRTTGAQHVDPRSNIPTPVAVPVAKPPPANDLDALFGPTTAAAPTSASSSSSQLPDNVVEVINAGVTNGVTLHAGLVPSDAAPVAFFLRITNNRSTTIDSVVLQLNRSRFGLAPAQSVQLPTPIGTKGVRDFTIPLATSEAHYVANPGFNVQAGVSLNGQVFTFTCDMPKRLAISFCKPLEKNEFARLWQTMDATQERPFTVQTTLTAEAALSKLVEYRLSLIASVPGGGGATRGFFAAKLHSGNLVLCEIVVPGGSVTLRSHRVDEAYETLRPVIVDALVAASKATAADAMPDFW